MNEPKNRPLPETVIQWLCPRCYEARRDIPSAKTRSRKKYQIWECGRWQQDGSCQICGNWALLTKYEWYDAEQKEARTAAQTARDRSYGRRKSTRVQYRERWDEA